ncbi:hypothetical protein J8F10_17370 [Gemmata sp. G18]|uniref:Uncharacterized protein n=1 Tax=Gemmata palustris TaxID=2822762 RepID=A0ABS5BTQ8_9BACT|nr:hypothetical protein [Gemmata palustris]MBP3957041.1 hypothetical protein [Gemmata palustris]
MKTILLVVVCAVGFAGLAGCGGSSASTLPGQPNGAAPQDSGAGKDTKKGRIPAQK